MAAILSLNGAKNNPKIVTNITAVRPKGGPSHKGPRPPPPKYATVLEGVDAGGAKVNRRYVDLFHRSTTLINDVSGAAGDSGVSPTWQNPLVLVT